MKKDNKGFTLIEVLIAVIILGFVIVPLLRSFVTSYNVNAKSRRMMRATTLAQNEMEIFEKEKLEVLLDDEVYDYDVDTTVIISDPGTLDELEHTQYTFSRSGIINDETGREMFDVVVKLDPETASVSDLYYMQNTQDLLFMNTLSASDSATYVQRIRSIDEYGTVIVENGEDEEVYQIYETRQYPEAVTGMRWTAAMFGQELSRTITVKIEQVDQGGLETTVAKVNYEYNFAVVTDPPIVPDEYKIYTTKDKVIFNNAQLLNEEGAPIELKSVYLFYAPRYDTPNVDKIVIENKDKLPVNVYIIRQNILDDMDNKLGVYTDSAGIPHNTVPTGYIADIEIYEGFNEDGKTYGSYFTNLNLNLPGTTEKGTTNITLHDSDGIWTYTGNQAIENAKFKSLGSTEAADRIYTMDVSVYNHGDDPDTDEPLVTLTGSKIE